MKRYDIIIIGGGVTGAAIARELSRYRGLRLGLLEKAEELAFGTSKSNSGIIHPGTQNSPGSLKGRLCVQGNHLMRGLCRELGVDFKEVGELIVAFDRQEMQRLNQLKVQAESLGVPGLKILGEAWLRRKEPNLNRKARGCLYAPSAGIISPYRLVYDLAENAAVNGADIFTGAAVEDIRSVKGYDFKISTSRGSFRTNYIINAAGLYSDVISAMAGVRNFRIRPRKGEEFILDKKLEHMTNHLLFPLPAGNSKGILIIKTTYGNPMIGPTAEEVDDKEDLSTTDAGLRKVLKAARIMIPSINEDDIIAYFAGLRPAAGDDFIIRHEDRAPGLINVAGIQSPGLTAAPAIAAMVTGMLKDDGMTMRRKLFFRAHRKKTTHLFAMPAERAAGLIGKDPSYGDIVCRCETVSAREVKDAIKRGAKTLDGIKFRTRAQAGRCHGSFCATRLLKMLSEGTKTPVTKITKRGKGSEVVMKEGRDD